MILTYISARLSRYEYQGSASICWAIFRFDPMKTGGKRVPRNAFVVQNVEFGTKYVPIQATAP